MAVAHLAKLCSETSAKISDVETERFASFCSYCMKSLVIVQGRSLAFSYTVGTAYGERGYAELEANNIKT